MSEFHTKRTNFQRKMRARLFKKSRPEIRRPVSDDMKYLWAAFKQNGSDIDMEDFPSVIEAYLSPYRNEKGEPEVHVIVDDNSNFEARRGIIGLVGAKTNGYLYEPHVEWLPWATKKNILRGAVSFFQRYRYQPIGVVRVHATDEAEKFFKRMKKYVPLNFVGKVPDGDELGRGDDFIFSMKSNKLYRADK